MSTTNTLYLLGDAHLNERAERGVHGGGALRQLQRVVCRQHAEQEPAAPVQRRDGQRRRAVAVCPPNMLNKMHTASSYTYTTIFL